MSAFQPRCHKLVFPSPLSLLNPTFDPILRPSNLRWDQDKPMCQISRSKVISFKSYRPDTHRHARSIALPGPQNGW